MILFESMLERASKNNVEIDRGRGIANGSLMLVAGTSFTGLHCVSRISFTDLFRKTGTGTTAAASKSPRCKDAMNISET